jgi:hypothetical protein
VRAQSSSSPLQSVVPLCAQSCLQQSMAISFAQVCPNEDFACLCTHYGSDGYTLGEKALSCIYSNICGQDAAPNPTPVYHICDSVANAVTPTHTNIQATLFDIPSSSTRLPSISTPTTSASNSQSTRAASSLAASPQVNSKKLDSTQIAAVALASVALFVVALTAAALLLLRSRRKPHDPEHDKDIDSTASRKSSNGSKSAHKREQPQIPRNKRQQSFSRNSAGAASRNSAGAASRNWPKYYRISPPPQLGSASGSSSSTLAGKTKTSNGRFSKPDISIVPDVDTKRRAVRISGFTTAPQHPIEVSPPERSPFRSSAVPNLSVQIPRTLNPTPPTSVLIATGQHPGQSAVFSGSGGTSSRNLVNDISRAASVGPIVSTLGESTSQRDPRSSRSKSRKSERSHTGKTVDSSPLTDKDRRSRDERRARRNRSKSKQSDHSRHREKNPSHLRTTGDLDDTPESPISNLQYPKVPRATTPKQPVGFSQASIARPIQTSTPPRTIVNDRYTPSSYSTPSTFRQSNTTPVSTTSFHYPFNFNGQRRLEVNSAPVMGPGVHVDQSHTPIYHSSWEVQKQASLQPVGAVSWPGAGASYGFF